MTTLVSVKNWKISRPWPLISPNIVAVSNPLRLGFNVVGHLRIHVDIGRIDQVAQQLKQIPALWFIVKTSGASTCIDAEFKLKLQSI